jgi:hypothetical protein
VTDPLSDGEIAERVAKDDAPRDETVLLKRSTSGTRHVYHDADEPCFEPTQSGHRGPAERTTRDDAIDRGLAPCKRCLIGFESDDPDRSTYERAKQFDPDRHDSLADISLGGDD